MTIYLNSFMRSKPLGHHSRFHLYLIFNSILDSDFQRLQEELDRAKQILSEVDKHWNDGQPIDFQVRNGSLGTLWYTNLIYLDQSWWKINAAERPQLP